MEPIALDETTRRLAADLRNLPHENVGITDPAVTSSGGAAPVRTVGTVVIALPASVLPRAVDLVQQASRNCHNRRFRIIGPNETQLDCDGALSSKTTAAWLSGLMKG